MSEPVIGLALSGGGSRAIAFHLGCLRALHGLGLLEKVKVLSSVSGGSVIGALYASSDVEFDEFEARVRKILERGLVWPSIKVAFTSMEGLKALACFLLLATTGIAIWLLRWSIYLLTWPFPGARVAIGADRWHPPFIRFASRSTILRRAMERELYGTGDLSALSKARPQLIINSAELRTGSAFYFAADGSGSWRLGKVGRSDISIAHAVVASAAHPLFLPALDENLAFNTRDGSRRVERVVLTDGGVYDNLGLAPLWPDRDPSVSLNVSAVDTIICCRAGYGLRQDAPTQFMVSRLASSFYCVQDRAQNATIKRLFDLREAGKLKGVVLPFLGQDDARMKFAPPDLVSREAAHSYPTDFSRMSAEWIDRLSKRGEQVMIALIKEHTPHLLLAAAE